MDTVSNSQSPLKQAEAFEFSFRLRDPLPGNARKCVLLLHGVGGNELNLVDLAAGIDQDTLVVFPRGPLSIAPNQFAWFRVVFTANGPSIVEAEAENSRRRMIRFVEQLQLAYGIQPENTVIAGFSQGGILSASVALSAPERVDGFAILSGRILPELKPHLANREQLAHLRGFVGHGQYDRTLPVMWSLRADHWLTDLGVRHVTRHYPIGHEISSAMQAEFLEWLEHE